MFTIIGADGKEYGPVATSRIAEWIAGGRANLQTKARRAGEAEWRTLGDFVEFNANASPPVLPAEVPPLPADYPAAAPAPVSFAAPTPTPASGPELAGRGTRLGAFFIDYILSVLAMVPGLLMLGPAFFGMMLAATRGQEPDLSAFNAGSFLIGLLVLILGALALLIVQIVMLSTRGQTIGKRLLGIRVVRYADGSPAGFVHGWLLRNFVPGLIQVLPWLGLAFAVADACCIFTDERRCLHDFIAGTKVVLA